MRRRRGRGEGSVFRRADGLWAGSFTIGYDDRGKRRRRVVYGAAKSEVLEALARLRHQSLTGTLGDAQRLTVADYLTRWLEDAARPAIREATYVLYSGLIRTHINPRLGGVALSRLTHDHVQGLLADMERQGASPKLRLLTYGVVRRALGQAVKTGMLPRNVCDAVTRPRAPRAAMRTLNSEQVGRLLQVAKGTRLEALYILAVTTGLRQGELLGLHWEDVDLKGAALHVRRQLCEVRGHLFSAEPKTTAARRRVDLPEMAVRALQAHRQRMLAEGYPHGLVFCNSGGNPIRKSDLRRRSFDGLLKAAGLPKIRFHDLRHTAATLLLQQGVHPKVVQERLGHSKISMTLDTYSHVLPSMQKEAAAQLDRLLAQSDG